MDPISKEQILLLYQDQLDNIRDLKLNQWKISHYGLIGQAAIFSVYNISKISSCPITYGFAFLSLLVFGYCIYVINQMQRMIAKRREALVYLSDEPAKTFSHVREKLRRDRREAPAKCRWGNEFSYGLLFHAAQGLGFAAVIFLILYQR